MKRFQTRIKLRKDRIQILNTLISLCWKGLSNVTHAQKT